MGGALIKGWAKSGKIDNITVADKNEALLAQFKKDYPALNITTDNVEAVKGADIVVLVVKPWLMKMVLAEVKHALDLDKQIIVSDAANFTTGMLAEELGAGTSLQSITEEDILQALKKVLHEPAYKESACRISESFRACGGAAEARAFLESLAGEKVPKD